MDNFEFYSPTRFVFGRGVETRTGELVRTTGGSKVMLVYGGGSIKANGIYDKVLDSLRKAEVEVVPLGGVRPNPRSGLVREGIARGRAERVDFLLAVGGGSVIDTAKAIAFGILYEGDFADFYFGKDVKKPVSVPKALPVGAVLTLAAAGSEASANSIINLEPGNLKRGATGDALRPRFAVMNPEFTYTLPPFQTACGAVDIFAHVVERYFTPTRNVEVGDELCEGLMRAVVAASRKALADPRDYDARAELMWAGSLAHNNICGVGRVQDWASHGIEHELSALYDCAHGAGLAVVMPAWLEYVKDADSIRVRRFAQRVFGAETAEEGISCYRAWIRELGLPQTFVELGARKEDIPMLVRKLGLNGGVIGGFKALTEGDVEAILNRAAEI